MDSKKMMARAMALALAGMAAFATRDAGAGIATQPFRDRAIRDLERDMRGESDDLGLIDLRYPNPHATAQNIAAHPGWYYVPANPTDVMVLPDAAAWGAYMQQNGWQSGGWPMLDPTLPRYNPAAF